MAGGDDEQGPLEEAARGETVDERSQAPIDVRDLGVVARDEVLERRRAREVRRERADLCAHGRQGERLLGRGHVDARAQLRGRLVRLARVGVVDHEEERLPSRAVHELEGLLRHLFPAPAAGH